LLTTCFHGWRWIFENSWKISKCRLQKSLKQEWLVLKVTLRSWKICTKYYEILTIYECVEKKSMITGCNIWMVCLELNWYFKDPSRILQLSEFVWTLRYSVWVSLTIFSLFLQQIEVRLVAITVEYFST